MARRQLMSELECDRKMRKPGYEKWRSSKESHCDDDVDDDDDDDGNNDD